METAHRQRFKIQVVQRRIKILSGEITNTFQRRVHEFFATLCISSFAVAKARSVLPALSAFMLHLPSPPTSYGAFLQGFN